MDGGRPGSWDLVLDVIHRVSAVDDPDQLAESVLEQLDRLVPSDLASFNEVDPLASRARVVVRPHFEADLQAWERWSHQHPVLMHTLRTGDGSARRLSDFLSADELHRLDLYRSVYRPLGVEHQLSVSLPAPRPLVLGFALNRGDVDFTDAEVALVDLLRPHLVQAHRRTLLLAEHRQRLESIEGALRREGRAFHVLGEPVSPASRAILASFFTDEMARDELPEQLARWADEERRAFDCGPPDRIRQPFVRRRDGRRLTVRYVPGGRGPDLLAVDVASAERDATPLRRLGLSGREAEVLWWLTRGASTAAVATELGLSVGTVKKHIERVHRKLGVSTRTAAVAQAFDALAVMADGTIDDETV